jgi:ankyrin repeat protein
MGDTILHYAAYKKNKDIISYLIKNGAQVTIKNSRGLTPRDVAVDQDAINLLDNVGQK